MSREARPSRYLQQLRQLVEMNIEQAPEWLTVNSWMPWHRQ